MRKQNLVTLLLFVFSLTSLSTVHAADRLQYGVERGGVINVADYKGQTFLSLMQETIKPALDQFAIEGYLIVDGDTAVAALDKVSKKVSSSALRSAGSKLQLKSIADQLNQTGQKYTLYNLDEAIREIDPSVDQYSLSTYLALVSGGGVAVNFTPDDIAYNVNYGTGNEDKDGQTGRSFGATATRGANDASDAAYLQDVQKFVQEPGITSFFRTIIEVLTNCDTSGYSSVSDFGRLVLTDFLAVYIAEQDRNLMKQTELKPWWDASLLEVTLLSYFHAGQKEMWVMWMTPPNQQEIDTMTTQTQEMIDQCLSGNTNPTKEEYQKCERRAIVPYENSQIIFTNDAVKQEKGGIARTQLYSNESKTVSMVDYWQFSFIVNKQQRGRSGINITKPAFRALGTEITNFERKYHPELVQAVESFLPEESRGGNIYEQLSNFLINDYTPKKLANGTELAQAIEKFLDQVRMDADIITGVVKANPRYAKNKFYLFK